MRPSSHLRSSLPPSLILADRYTEELRPAERQGVIQVVEMVQMQATRTDYNAYLQLRGWMVHYFQNVIAGRPSGRLSHGE